MRRSPRTRLFAAPVALIASFALVACGGDDDDDTSATTEATEPAEATTGSTGSTATTGTTAESGTGGTTATSGGGEVGSQDDYIEATQGEISDEFGELGDCVSEALVNDDVYAAIQEAELSVEQFAEDGPAGLSLDAAVAETVGADMAACGDLLAELFEGTDLSCATDNLTNEQAAAGLAYNVLGLEPTAELQSAFDAVDACLAESTATTT